MVICQSIKRIKAVRFFASAAAGIKVSNLRISLLVSRELNNFREKKYEKAVLYCFGIPFFVSSALRLRHAGGNGLYNPFQRHG